MSAEPDRGRGVTHAYPVGQGRARARTVLRDVDVTLAEQRVGVVGANGSGKSTFARLLNGLVLPDQRQRVGRRPRHPRGRPRVRRRVGFCFTDPDAQIVMPTVREDVAFGLRRRGLSKAEVRRAGRRRCWRATGSADHADHPAHLLSGGQKQLLALASVLVTEPDGPRARRADHPARPAQRPARRRGPSAALPQQVVLVTHHLDLLDGYDRVLVFDEGRLVHDAHAGRRGGVLPATDGGAT